MALSKEVKDKLSEVLARIERFTINPSSFTDEELKELSNDTPLFKVLKKHARDLRLVPSYADLENQIKNKDNDISQKDKAINSLQLKNEKLTESYKKLIQHLANARQLVSHLQKDLQTEKQDKNHIQQELGQVKDKLVQTENDLKPFLEIGLTAEQIKQMEQDLEYQRKLLYQGANEIDKLEKDLLTIKVEKIKKEQEIKSLVDKVQDLEPNQEEQTLINYSGWKKWTNLEMAKMILETGKIPNEPNNTANWSNLRSDYSNIRNKLLELVNSLIKEKQLGAKIDERNKEIDKQSQTIIDLQTKYDMEVKSKEEIAELLSIYEKHCSYFFPINNNPLVVVPNEIKKTLERISPRFFLLFGLYKPTEYDFSYLNPNKRQDVNYVVFSDGITKRQTFLLPTGYDHSFQYRGKTIAYDANSSVGSLSFYSGQNQTEMEIVKSSRIPDSEFDKVEYEIVLKN